MVVVNEERGIMGIPNKKIPRLIRLGSSCELCPDG